jgi:hypothetical protein
MGVLSVCLVSRAGTEEATLKTKTVFMNHQTLKLEPLSDQELISIEGGTIPSWMKRFGWSGLIMDAIQSWNEIKSEFSRGWHFADNK